jgi:hypothetical protein
MDVGFDLDISNTIYIIAILVSVSLLWATTTLAGSQAIGTMIILSQFILIKYYGAKLTETGT